MRRSRFSRWIRRSVVRALALSAVGASLAGAQAIRGTIRDSITSTPIAGAVVTLLDASGSNVGRTLSNASGAFMLTGAGARIRVVRIGFRPFSVAAPAASDSTATISILLSRLPSLLEAVKVTAAAKCDKRVDNVAAQALLGQARAGLLNTIVAGEANRVNIVRLAYERTYSRRADTVAPSVRLDSTVGSTKSFTAVRKGVDLVRRGFTADSLGKGIYFAPDAEVLLDEGFEAGYCFQVLDGRGNQVGLGFSPVASRRIGRIDVEGVLWVDTVARSLRDLEYRYVTGGSGDDSNLGGDLAYQELPNGAVIATRWSVRLRKVRVDPPGPRGGSSRYTVVLSEAGGQVVRATWPDGTTWSAPLGSVEITAVSGVDGRQNVPLGVVRLRNTDYFARTDTSGVAVIRDVLPGRYEPEVVNPDLVAFGFYGGDPKNVGSADSTLTRSSRVSAFSAQPLAANTVLVRANETAKKFARMPSVDDAVRERCGGTRLDPSKGRAILGQVVSASGLPVDSAVVTTDVGLPAVRTDDGGSFVICLPATMSENEISVGADRGARIATPVTVKLTGTTTLTRLVLNDR